jgi:hypothetical protein
VRVGPLLVLGVLSATAALLAACSTGPGPLGDGGSQGTQCTPWREGVPVAMGFYDLENSGTSPVKVQSVSLGSPHGLKITSKAWLMPIYHDIKEGNWHVAGVVFRYPPTKWPEWSHREAARGAVMRPGQDLNLIFAMTRTWTRDGRSDGPVVTYLANGGSYTLQERTGLILAAKNSC